MYSTSAALLERVRQRTDQAAWDRFIRLYTPFLYRCGMRLGLAEAADAVQDVFVVLLDKLPMFDYAEEGSFRAWLRTVSTLRPVPPHVGTTNSLRSHDGSPLRFTPTCVGTTQREAERRNAGGKVESP